MNKKITFITPENLKPYFKKRIAETDAMMKKLREMNSKTNVVDLRMN